MPFQKPKLKKTDKNFMVILLNFIKMSQCVESWFVFALTGTPKRRMTCIFFVLSKFQSKQKSEQRVITHGDELTLGTTTLHLHIHPGTQTCDSCEPGQVQAQAHQGTSCALDDEGTCTQILQVLYTAGAQFHSCQHKVTNKN